MGQGTRAVTLTLGASAIDLLDAIQALGGTYATAQNGCAYITVRGDDSLTGAQYIYVGDANVSSSNYGTRLSQGDSSTLSPGFHYSCSLSTLYVLGSTTGLKCNVTWVESV